MLNIEIINEQEERNLSENQLEIMKRVVVETARIEGIEEGEVAITLVNDEEIHRLNKEYRGVDRPTDVLSFAMNDEVEDDFEIFFEEEEDMNELPNMLGDIIISIPRVIEQANDYGHSFDRELGFLTVHGFLHLLGYDHQEETEEKEMFAKQEEVLQNLGLFR